MFNPPNPRTFNALVWKIVREIPEGQVSTYGQIASMIQPPPDVDPARYKNLSPRWVGSAMRAKPDAPIPWQRVINSQGTISIPKGSSGAEQQRMLLEAEGVIFDERGRVDFETYGWDGPDEDFLRAHDLLPPSLLRKKKGSRQKPLF